MGSERDPEALRQAQATWQIAQMNYNQTYFAKEDEHVRYICNGMDEITGLKKSAMENFMVAAGMLESEGHTEASKRLEAVAQSITLDSGVEPKSPASIAYSILWNKNRAVQDMNIGLGEDRWSVGTGFADTLDRLGKIVSEVEVPKPEQGQAPDQAP